MMNLKSPLILNSQVVILSEDEVIDALKAKFGDDVSVDYDKGNVWFSKDDDDDFDDKVSEFLGESLGVEIVNIYSSDGDQIFDGFLVFYSEKK